MINENFRREVDEAFAKAMQECPPYLSKAHYSLFLSGIEFGLCKAQEASKKRAAALTELVTARFSALENKLIRVEAVIEHSERNGQLGDTLRADLRKVLRS